MAEELISQYVDRDSISGDTKFLTDQLKAILDLFDQVNAKRITLSGVSSLKDVTANADAAQKAFDKLTTENKKLQASYDQLAKATAASLKDAKDTIAANGEIARSNKVVADSYDKVVKQLVENEVESNELKRQRKELNASFAEGKIDLELYKKKLEEIRKAESSIAVSNQDLNRGLRNFEKEAQAAAGSTNELRAQLNQALQALDGLSEAEKNSDIGTGIKKNIATLSAAITEAEQSTGRFQRNVGNYPGAAKIIVDALGEVEKKISDLQVKQQGLADFSKRNPIGFRTSGGQNDLDQTNAQLKTLTTQAQSLGAITSNPQFLNVAGKVGDTNAELKFFTKQLNQLEDAGLKNEQVYKDVQKRLAELTDQLGDTRAEIKALSSDTRSFDLFAGAVNFAADTFQTFAGVLALGTDNEKEAQEALKTLIAIQTISNGVKGIANELTTKGTAANKLFAFSQKQIAIAMDSTAASGARLRAALITLGIGALIIGIGLLVANFSKLKDALSGLSTTQKAINDINKKAIEGYVQERVHVEALVKQLQSENTSKQRKKELIKELNNLSPAYFSNIKSEKDLQDKLNESVLKYIRAIELKARAQAAESALVDTEKPIIERQIELQRQLLALNDKTFDSDERKQRNIKGLTNVIEESNKALSTGVITPNVDKVIAELIKQRGPIQKIVTDINTELNGLGGDPNGPIQLPFAANKKAYTDELQAQSEAYKKLSENEDAYFITRFSARSKALELQKRILSAQKATEIENLNAQIAVEAAKGIIDENTQKGFNQTRLDIQNDYAEKGRVLERAYGEDIFNIRQTSIAKQRELEEKDNADFFKDQEDQLNASVEKIQNEQQRRLENNVQGQQAEIEALNSWYEKRVAATREGSKARNKVEEKYARDRAEIEFRYADAALKNEIDAAEKILAVHKAAGIDVTEEEKKIHELKIQLSDIETKHVIDNEKKKKKTRDEVLQDTIDGIQFIQGLESQVASVIGGFISNQTEAKKNAIQQEIDAIDKKKEKEIEEVNASALSEKEKADKIAVINARAASNKEAQERRQRQLDLQRARFEKAANIAQIILKTALAVAQGLIQGGPPLAAVYGAIGAAELAVAIATPLPKFKHGREGGPATWGVTGDGGVHEVVSSPDLKQSFVTPATDTLTYLPEGWKVFPNVKEFQDAAVNMVHKPLPSMPVLNHNNNDGLIRAMAYEIGGLKRAIMGKQETHFHWNNGELQKSIKNGNSWDHYIQNNI